MTKETKPRLRCPDCKEELLAYQVKPRIDGKYKYIFVRKNEAKYCVKCEKNVMLVDAVIKKSKMIPEITYKKYQEK